MCVPTSQRPEPELLELVSAITTPRGLTQAALTLDEVAAAGRAAWTWRGVDEELVAVLSAACQDGPD